MQSVLWATGWRWNVNLSSSCNINKNKYYVFLNKILLILSWKNIWVEKKIHTAAHEYQKSLWIFVTIAFG